MRIGLALSALAAFADSAPYSEDRAKIYVQLSGAASCAMHGVSDWSCPACVSPGVEATPVIDTATNTLGYVGFVPELNEIHVAFSGTDPNSLKNWLSDLDTVQTTYPLCTGCLAHRGFYNAYVAVQSQVRQLVENMSVKHPDAAGVSYSGHSLGGALVFFAALDLENRGHHTAGFYTYGQPRVSNDALRLYFQSVIPEPYRLTHFKDPVPHIPGEISGFHHATTEVYYDEAGTSYKICATNEDKQCSDGNAWNGNNVMHEVYVGFNYSANFKSCN